MDSGRVRGGRLGAWGPVDTFCFEGDSCLWTVRGGGTVSIVLDGPPGKRRRVETIVVAARGWKTRKGVGPGATVAKVRRKYPRARFRHGCYGYNGSPVRGLVLRHKRSRTIFEFAAGARRISAIRLAHGARTPKLPC